MDAAARGALIAVAGAAASAAVRGLPPPCLPAGLPPALLAAAGAFVTLHRDDELRGCVGRVTPDGSLVSLVARVAVRAALHDPRFPPVRAQELAALDVEISVLSPPAPIARDAVDPARDGLLVRAGTHHAVLLPQVASRYGWDRETLLARLCEKAGIAAGRLTDDGVELLAFRAVVVTGRLRDAATPVR